MPRVHGIAVACACELTEVRRWSITAVPMTVGRVYNRCIGTEAEGPEKGMHSDDIGILDPTEM